MLKELPEVSEEVAEQVRQMLQQRFDDIFMGDYMVVVPHTLFDSEAGNEGFNVSYNARPSVRAQTEGE